MSQIFDDDGLSLYDKNREPRPIITGRKVQVPLESLRGDMNCPICLSILRNTSMTLECSHRFCKSCIEQSLRMNSHDCPSCRIKVTTRRSLRDDSRFDNLIKAIYGDLNNFEKREEKWNKSLKKESQEREYKKIIEQAQERKRATSSSSTSNNNSLKTNTSNMHEENIESSPLRKKKKMSANVGALPHEDMLFVLRKHPLEVLPSATKKEYIKASIRLTVGNMIQFIVSQYKAHNIIDASFFRIQVVYHDHNGEEFALAETDSLSDIVERFKNGNRSLDLILHYKIIR